MLSFFLTNKDEYISDFSGHIFRETSVEWHCAKQWGSEIERGTKVQSLICINRVYICKSGAIFSSIR